MTTEGWVEYRPIHGFESPKLNRFPFSQPFMTQKVIFFDIDGTLLSTGGAGQKALELALVDGFGIDAPFEGVLTSGRTDRGIVDELLKRYQIQNTQEHRDQFRNAYLKRLPECLENAPGKLLPNVVDLVSKLAQQKHITLSVLTGNYVDASWIKLRHYQLDQFFTFGGFGGQLAERDDVARAALKAASDAMDFEVDGANTMVIGDTPADIRCARAIGAKAVGVATGSYNAQELATHKPDYVCDDFSATDSVAQTLLDLL